MLDAVIVSGVRTPIGKAPHGALSEVRPDDLAALVIREAIRRAPGLNPAEVDDVVLGCAIPEGEQGLNVARLASALAGLPTSVPAMTVNRFCASGLQAIAIAAQHIQAGMAEVCVAGGTESMSRVYSNLKLAPNPTLMDQAPAHYMAMGHTAEEVARRFSISREDQDAFGLESHRRAAAAIREGRFVDEVLPVPVRRVRLEGDGKVRATETFFDTDEGVRFDTNLDAMARLKPAFSASGTVTAANSSQMSDGAAAVVVMSEEKAKALGKKPLARIVAQAQAAMAPEWFTIAPAEAMKICLEKAKLKSSEIDLWEVNEAFSVVALANNQKIGIPADKVNVNGGAVAMGHPIGASGARILTTLLYEMKHRAAKRGLASLCIGGGEAVALIVEAV